MEASGELISPTPQERIRQAALGHLLDLDSTQGVKGSGSNGPDGRLAVFMLEVDSPQEDLLNFAEIHEGGMGLFVAMSHFRKELGVPYDTWALTGFAFINFLDPFDAETATGDNLSFTEANRIAEILEDENLQVFEVTSADSRMMALLVASGIAHDLVGNRLVSMALEEDEKHMAREPESKTRKVATRLRRILKF